jgi:hypothetical protein
MWLEACHSWLELVMGVNTEEMNVVESDEGLMGG